MPCGEGAYNLSTQFFLSDETGAGWRRAPFVRGAVAEAADFSLVNASFAPADMSLSAFSKGRGLGDCGEASKWVWDGRRFVLAERSAMGDCRGVPPDLWPTTHRVQLRR